MSSTAAFDNVAFSYDFEFTNRQLGRLLRNRVWNIMDRTFPSGGRILELGCGTGEDATHLAQNGLDVVATDVSEDMLRVARAKARAHRLHHRVEFRLLNMQSLERGYFAERTFAGGVSNFGALNCLPNRRDLAQSLAHWLKPGARFIAVVMGPVCMWETLANLARLRPLQAVRRLRNGRQARVGDGSLPVWYPSPTTLCDEFAPWFTPVHSEALGVLLPTSEDADAVERYPRTFEVAAALEARLAGTVPLRWLGDHTVWVFERSAT